MSVLSADPTAVASAAESVAVTRRPPSRLAGRLIAQLNARAGGYRQGRGREENWPPIPEIPRYRVEAVADWMQTHRENRRPLSVAAPLMAIVCALAEAGYPLPTRPRLAASIGCTKDGVDAALSTALAYGEVTERYEVIEGAVSQRKSSRRVRYVDPAPELLEIYRAARRYQNYQQDAG